MKIEILYKNIDELKEIPKIKNLSCPWTENEKALMKESLQKDGFNIGLSRILVTKDMEIIDGYKRVALAKEIGIKKVPVQIYSIEPDNFRVQEISQEIANLRLIRIAVQRNIGHKLSDSELKKIQKLTRKIEQEKEKKETKSNKIIEKIIGMKIAV